MNPDAPGRVRAWFSKPVPGLGPTDHLGSNDQKSDIIFDMDYLYLILIAREERSPHHFANTDSSSPLLLSEGGVSLFFLYSFTILISKKKFIPKKKIPKIKKLLDMC